MTIEQIQTAIDQKLDARQIINMIADFLQLNTGFPEILDEDTLINLNGEELIFHNGDPENDQFWYVDPSSFLNKLAATDGTAEAGLELSGDGVNASFLLRSDDDINDPVRIAGSSLDQTITLTADNGTLLTLPESDPHIAGAPYWNGTTLTKSAG